MDKCTDTRACVILAVTLLVTNDQYRKDIKHKTKMAWLFFLFFSSLSKTQITKPWAFVRFLCTIIFLPSCASVLAILRDHSDVFIHRRCLFPLFFSWKIFFFGIVPVNSWRCRSICLNHTSHNLYINMQLQPLAKIKWNNNDIKRAINAEIKAN